ncbi:P-selectin glycoprotein ligand 1 [Centroberyx affinis]|uniref:P-selectin glycoprotein ligand 1 n=1 Tax=Centroberyx affinis TaxID=166261 RepID=UPI003A5BF029
MLVSMKMCAALLWAVSVLFSVECKNTTVPEISSSSSTAPPTTTTETANHLTTPVRHHEEDRQPTSIPDNNNNDTATTSIPSHKPAQIDAPSTTAAPENTVPHSTESEGTPGSTQSHTLDSRGGTTGAAVMNTSVGTVTSSGPQLDHTSTVPLAPITVPGAAQPSSTANVSETEKPTEHPSASITANVSETEKPTEHPSASITANVSETEKPTEHPSGQQSVMTSTELSATPSAAGLVSSSTTKPNATSTLSSITRTATPAPLSTHEVNSPTVSITTSGPSTVIATNSTFPVSVFDLSNTSTSNTEMSTASTELPSTSQPISPTRTPVSSSKVPDTTGPSSTTKSPRTTEAVSNISDTSTTAVSNSSSAGVLIPRIPKRLPVVTIKSPSATTTVHRKKSTSGPGVQPCSTSRRDGVVNKCLIAIASLAGLATIFIVSTIILCAKLSSRKYRYRMRDSPQGTEMVCISALLPDRSSYGRYRRPVSNGALLPNTEGDSDEDGGDNLTLSSFLPENDRVV